MAVRFTVRRTDAPGESRIVIPTAYEGWVRGEGSAVIDNPMCSVLLEVKYPVQISWRRVKPSTQEDEHYEIGAVGTMVHRITKQRMPGIMPVRRFSSLEDMSYMWDKLQTGEIALVDAPSYVLGEETHGGEPVETIAQIHARLSRKRYGGRQRRI